MDFCSPLTFSCSSGDISDSILGSCDVEDDSDEERRRKTELGRSAGFENKVPGTAELWNDRFE